MKKEMLVLWIGFVFLTGCAYIEGGTSGGVFTDFEVLDLSAHFEQNITVRGQAYRDINAMVSGEINLYGLRDKNGFDIFFVPRGGRVLEDWKEYTIKGEVLKGEKGHCGWFGPENCEIYYLKEIKP